MKKRWFLILVPAILAAAALALTMSTELRIRLMPRTVLRKAITEASLELQQRFEDNPILHIASVIDLADQQIRFHTGSEGTQENTVIHLSPRRIAGSLSSGALSAEFYTDEDSLAISSGQLTDGRWLGIAYDSFSEDIGKIPLIRWILSDSMLRSWENSLGELRDGILKEVHIPSLPKVTQEDLSKLSLALAAMKTTVSQTVIQTEQGPEECFRILCEADGSTWNPLFAVDEEWSDTAVSCVFYLRDTHLVLAQLTAESGRQQLRLHLEADGAIADDPISVRYSRREGEKEESYSARIATDRPGDVLSEQWELSINDSRHSFSYQWEEASGSGTVNFSEEEVPFQLTLQPQGFHLVTTNSSVLTRIFPLENPFREQQERWEIDVRPGAAPERPEFRTPDTWTTEDLLTLLEGLGDVLDLPFP